MRRGRQAKHEKMILGAGRCWALLRSKRRLFSFSISEPAFPLREGGAGQYEIFQASRVISTQIVFALAVMLTPAVNAFAVDRALMPAPSHDGRSTVLFSARSIPTPAVPSDAERARVFLIQHPREFSSGEMPVEWIPTRVTRHQSGQRNVVRLQQQYQGIDINGAEAIVHIDRDGVRRVRTTAVSGLQRVDMIPGVTRSQAEALAKADTAQRSRRGVDVRSTPSLEIINVARLRGHGVSTWQLAWRMDVTGPGIDDTVWIDAHGGTVLHRHARVAHAFITYIVDNNETCPSNPPLLGYDDASDYSLAPETVSDTFTYLQASYDYFFRILSRDGFHDAAGGARTINALVGECADVFATNTGRARESAAWDPAAFTLRLGAGMSGADDIVGHEYGHAVIDEDARFALTGQSGALAEAFADIFGELIDLQQATSNDAGDTRWAIGEDAPGGPFRNLRSPALFQQPGKVTDADRYYCGFDADVAIHTNSSVLTHAFALLADGGTYNGTTMSGIAIDAAARIFYRALTDHLTRSATFSEAYQELLNAADDLIAESVITAADKRELVKALNAVELNATPCNTQLPYCPTGHTPVVSFFDGFENTTSGNWSNTVAMGINHWNTGVGTPAIYHASAVDPKPVDFNDPKNITVARRGQYGLWGDAARDSLDAGRRTGDSAVVTARAIEIPLGSTFFLQFESQFQFQVWEAAGMPIGGPEPDGAVVEYSTDGITWIDAGGLMSAGQGYTGTIQSDLLNPLSGRNAFVGATQNYVSTQIDLSSLAGQKVFFRFRIGTDKTGGDIGWFIDDVAVYSCAASQLVVTPISGLETSEGGNQATFTIALAAPPTLPVTVALASSNIDEGTVDPAFVYFDETNWNVPQTITVRGVDDLRSDGTQGYTITVSISQSSEVSFQSSAEVVVSISNYDNDTEVKSSGGGAWGIGGLLFLLLARRRLRRTRLH